MDITIEATVSPKTGFASHQNAVPLLRDLSVTNRGDHTFNDMTLELSADLPFLQLKRGVSTA